MWPEGPSSDTVLISKISERGVKRLKLSKEKTSYICQHLSQTQIALNDVERKYGGKKINNNNNCEPVSPRFRSSVLTVTVQLLFCRLSISKMWRWIQDWSVIEAAEKLFKPSFCYFTDTWNVSKRIRVWFATLANEQLTPIIQFVLCYIKCSLL